MKTLSTAERDAFLKRFRMIFPADQAGKTGEKLAHVHARPMIIGNALKKNGQREAETAEQQPHQRPSFE